MSWLDAACNPLDHPGCYDPDGHSDGCEHRGDAALTDLFATDADLDARGVADIPDLARYENDEVTS